MSRCGFASPFQNVLLLLFSGANEQFLNRNERGKDVKSSMKDYTIVGKGVNPKKKKQYGYVGRRASLEIVFSVDLLYLTEYTNILHCLMGLLFRSHGFA